MKNADMPAMPSRVSLNKQRTEVLPYQFGHHDFVGPGLTKREYLAAMAMQGYCAAPDTEELSVEYLARAAVRQADALLAELEKSGE